MKPITEIGQATAPTAACPESAFLVGSAISNYPFAGGVATGYAARIIAARFGVSPVIASAIAALAGIGEVQP